MTNRIASVPRHPIVVLLVVALMVGSCSVESERVSSTAAGLDLSVQERTVVSAVEPTAVPVPQVEPRPVPTDVPVATVVPAPTPTETATPESTVEVDSDFLRPGEGQLVNMARANWSSGYVQAQILHDLMEELGYIVASPDEYEFAPDLAYLSIAEGDVDFWANSWYPGHLFWWEGERSDGTPMADHLVRLQGSVVPGGGLQGLLITKSWADEFSITTMDQINEDAALYEALDSDGNGKGEFFGCDERWTCDDIMESQIVFAGWNNLEQIDREYDVMFDDFMEKVEAGEPAIAYIWTPTGYYARAEPGELTMWLSVENSSVLDNSNPLELSGGEDYCQRCGPDGAVSTTDIGFTGVSADTCLIGPDGCQLGWLGSDIEVTANADWLAGNPAAEALFLAFNPSLFDLSVAGAAYNDSAGSQSDIEAVAADWIADNPMLVDDWLTAARTAASES